MDGYSTLNGIAPLEMNGHSIIAAVYIRSGYLLIMGETYNPAGVLTYVVSEMREGADYWDSGTYFDGEDSKANKARARLNFSERMQDAWKL